MLIIPKHWLKLIHSIQDMIATIERFLWVYVLLTFSLCLSHLSVVLQVNLNWNCQLTDKMNVSRISSVMRVSPRASTIPSGYPGTWQITLHRDQISKMLLCYSTFIHWCLFINNANLQSLASSEFIYTCIYIDKYIKLYTFAKNFLLCGDFK